CRNRRRHRGDRLAHRHPGRRRFGVGQAALHLHPSQNPPPHRTGGLPDYSVPSRGGNFHPPAQASSGARNRPTEYGAALAFRGIDLHRPCLPGTAHELGETARDDRREPGSRLGQPEGPVSFLWEVTQARLAKVSVLLGLLALIGLAIAVALFVGGRERTALAVE